MGLHTHLVIALLAMLFCFPLLCEPADQGPKSLRESKKASLMANRILFLAQQGQVKSALQLYDEYREHLGKHDFDLLQHLGLVLLDQGFNSEEMEVKVMTIYGAGISNNDRALYILEEGILSNIPQVQLISMNLLARLQNDYADHAINHCLRSNHLLIRLEAAYHLCLKKHPKAIAQTESLMAKVDPTLHPAFPQLFAMAGTDQALKVLRKLLAHQNEEVRLAAIQSAAKYGRDDLLPQIRILSTHHPIAQQEICAIALGELGDTASVDRLKEMCLTTSPSVKLAALQALYRLDCKEASKGIMGAAQEKFLPAIGMLGELEGSEQLLTRLVQDQDLNIRINAAIALLEKRDPRCLGPLTEILIQDQRDLALVRGYSLGRGLPVWKVIASASQRAEEIPQLNELSLNSLELIISHAIDLPEKEFLDLCHQILNSRQSRLVPTVIPLLERLRTPGAIALLKSHQQQAGAPLIRNYCNLALYRLGEEGPYGESLRKWVYQEQSHEMIRFRPYVPWEIREMELHNAYQLTPEETSKLLVESFETLAQKQDDHGIEILLEAIKLGNSKNRYVLAGLLIRSAQ